MYKQVAQFYKNQTKTAVVITVVLGFAAYRVVNKILNKEVIPERPPIPPIPPAERKYSYTAEQYPEFADALEEAFDGAFTDNDRVKSIMEKMKTKGDVVALISAYGKRTITNPFGFDTDAMTLARTITYEMDASDIEKYVNVPLSRTGFKF